MTALIGLDVVGGPEHAFLPDPVLDDLATVWETSTGLYWTLTTVGK